MNPTTHLATATPYASALVIVLNWLCVGLLHMPTFPIEVTGAFIVLLSPLVSVLGKRYGVEIDPPPVKDPVS